MFYFNFILFIAYFFLLDAHISSNTSSIQESQLLFWEVIWFLPNLFETSLHFLLLLQAFTSCIAFSPEEFLSQRIYCSDFCLSKEKVPLKCIQDEHCIYDAGASILKEWCFVFWKIKLLWSSLSVFEWKKNFEKPCTFMVLIHSYFTSHLCCSVTFIKSRRASSAII